MFQEEAIFVFQGVVKQIFRRVLRVEVSKIGRDHVLPVFKQTFEEVFC